MISLFTHYSGLREYVGTENDMPPFDVPNGSKFSQMDGKPIGLMVKTIGGFPAMVI